MNCDIYKWANETVQSVISTHKHNVSRRNQDNANCVSKLFCTFIYSISDFST